MSRIWYNSCRHRSCPQCAYLQTERWIVQQQTRLLACDHYHAIFTLPHALNPLWLANVPRMTPLLFQAVRDTLGTLLADPKYLGAQPGVLMALHTWSQTLVLHQPEHGADGVSRITDVMVEPTVVSAVVLHDDGSTIQRALGVASDCVVDVEVTDVDHGGGARGAVDIANLMLQKIGVA